MRLVSRDKQKGIAALTAILVVVIATVLAVNLLWTTSVDIQRTQTVLQQDQARLYDLGGEELAKYILKDDFNTGSSGVDTTKETWAKLLVREFKEGTLEGWLVDQQGLFDLNSLIDATGTINPDAQERFKRLLQLLELDPPLDSGTADELADAAIDWLDGNTLPEPNGAEDGYYTNLQPPYVAANYWFTSASELQAVKGYTPEILLKLTPHVTALPPNPAAAWPLNVNTATDLVLASLVQGPTASSVVSVYRQDYQLVGDFTTAFELATGVSLTANPPAIPLNTGSSWFLLTVTTTIGTTRSTMYSLLERDANTGVVNSRLRTFDAN